MLLLAALGCMKIDYLTAEPAMTAGETFWRHRMLWGLVEVGGPLDVGALCPTGIAKLHTEYSLGNFAAMAGLAVAGAAAAGGGAAASGNPAGGALGFVAFIYTPSTITVWCNEGDVYQVEPADGGSALYFPADQGPPALADGLAWTLLPDPQPERDARLEEAR